MYACAAGGYGNAFKDVHEENMKCIAIVGAALVAVLAVAAAPAAHARARHHQKAAHHCVDRPRHDTGPFGFFFNPAPEPNGCAPPVYVYGRYQGQDPDPYIRQQLLRDPQTGYRPF